MSYIRGHEFESIEMQNLKKKCPCFDLDSIAPVKEFADYM
jgi:hypothetical protein